MFNVHVKLFSGTKRVAGSLQITEENCIIGNYQQHENCNACQ